MTVSTNNTYNNAPTTASVAGGTIDNAPIGSTTPSTGAFTTLSATGQSTITTVLSGATANFTDFPRAQVVISIANTGATDPGIHALVCESKSDGTYNAHGLDGTAATNGTGAAAGISGTARVTATGDTGGAFGVFASADAVHAGGANYGVYSSATNGATNYSFYGAAGTLYNVGAATIGGVTSLAAGTVSAPSLTLSTDTTTGLYRIGANNDGYAVSGSKVLDIGSAGLTVTGALAQTVHSATLNNLLGFFDRANGTYSTTSTATGSIAISAGLYAVYVSPDATSAVAGSMYLINKNAGGVNITAVLNDATITVSVNGSNFVVVAYSGGTSRTVQMSVVKLI